MRVRAVSAAFVALAATAGCGGGLAQERADPHPRESDELEARHWHARVVQLERETAVSAEQGEPCSLRCALAGRACELTAQICALAASDENDEGTAMLCEDARSRCATASASARSRCACG
jgi:hypothetical protein